MTPSTLRPLALLALGAALAGPARADWNIYTHAPQAGLVRSTDGAGFVKAFLDAYGSGETEWETEVAIVAAMPDGFKDGLAVPYRVAKEFYVGPAKVRTYQRQLDEGSSDKTRAFALEDHEVEVIEAAAKGRELGAAAGFTEDSIRIPVALGAQLMAVGFSRSVVEKTLAKVVADMPNHDDHALSASDLRTRLYLSNFETRIARLDEDFSPFRDDDFKATWMADEARALMTLSWNDAGDEVARLAGGTRQAAPGDTSGTGTALLGSGD